MNSLTPRDIVRELNRHIVGQDAAKRAVAIALRNRWRRIQLPQDVRQDIKPKNILMIGPTGVGKTEIARRLARISQAPFVKIEATKYTEVGYVGRDVEHMIRDLVDIAIAQQKKIWQTRVAKEAVKYATERLLDQLVGPDAAAETREKFRQKLDTPDFQTTPLEIDVAETTSPVTNLDIPGMPQGHIMNLTDLLGKNLPKRTKKRRVTVGEAKKIWQEEESEKLLDMDHITQEALTLAEEHGIIFIDEMDKICDGQHQRGQVSREGVQRDLLPFLEGTVVTTKYGPVKTDHILFIASGAFHVARPSDLLPELQGRLPIRVELHSLKAKDFARILQEPEMNLIQQCVLLFGVEHIKLHVTPCAIETLAHQAEELNQNVENIGARRLHTLVEKVVESLSYTGEDFAHTDVTIDREYVQTQLKDIIKRQDISRMIL